MNLLRQSTKITAFETLFGILEYLLPTASLENHDRLFAQLIAIDRPTNFPNSSWLYCIDRLFKFGNLLTSHAVGFLGHAQIFLESGDWAAQADAIAIIRKIAVKYPELIMPVNESGMVHRLVRDTAPEREYVWIKICGAVQYLIVDNRTVLAFADAGLLERFAVLVASEMDHLVIKVFKCLASAVKMSSPILERVIAMGILVREDFTGMEFRVKTACIDCWEVVMENCRAHDSLRFGPNAFENATAMLDASDERVLGTVLRLVHSLIQAGVPVPSDCPACLESIAICSDNDGNGMRARAILESLRRVE
jgi:hypothetical protein